MVIPSSSSSRSIMAILSGNFISSKATQLQNHVFLIPWVGKKVKMGTISCSKGRDYSKSVPVRYIPKKASENNESEVSSSLPKSQCDDIKEHDNFESNGREQNSFSGRSFVAGTKFEEQHEIPISKINFNNEYDTRRVAPSNFERIQLSRSPLVSCIRSTSNVDSELQSENGKPLSNVSDNVGEETGRVFQPNAGRIEPTIQASGSSWSFSTGREFGNQSEKPVNNINNDICQGTSGVVHPDVERIDSSKCAETSCSSNNVGVEPEFQNLNERPINRAKYERELDTSSNVISDLPRIELAESLQTSFSDSSFMADTQYQDQNRKPINKAKYDVGLGTSRVVQSNILKVEHSNSQQTSCNGRSFVPDTEELGVGEEFDGDMHFEDSELVEEIEGHSKKKNHESHGMRVNIKEDVQKLAVELLAGRALTALELRKKLQGKKFPLHVVDAIIRDFKARWSSSTWGPRRIKKALYSKGVSEGDAEKAVKSVFNDDSACDDQESNLGMSKLSMDHLFAQASKQWTRSHDASIEKRKARITRWLQYRGFSWSVISIILKKLTSKYST